MAITVPYSDKAAAATSGTTNVAQTAGATTSGLSINLLVVCVNWSGVASVTVSDTINGSASGNTWTALTATQLAGNAGSSQLFYCWAPNTGVSHVFKAQSSSAGYINIAVFGAAGTVGAGTPTQAAGGSTTATVTTIQPGSLTPAGNGYLLITSLTCSGGTPTGTPIDSGFTAQTTAFSSGVHLGGGGAYLVQTTAAPVNPTWSFSSASNITSVMAAFAPSGGATLSVSPTTVYAGSSGNTLTLTGSGTSWTAGTPGTPSFTASAGTITAQSVASGTSATLTYTAPSGHGSQTITITDPSTGATATVTTVVPVTDTGLYFSPGNWYSNGSGSYASNNILSSSTYALSNNPGAYLKTNLVSTTASGSITINLDTSILNTITAANTPVLAWSVDGAAYSSQQLSYSASPVTITLGSSLSSATHAVDLWFMAVDLSSTSSMGDRWNTPTTGFSGVKITGVVTDTGSTVSTPTLRPKRAIWLSDSSGEGAQNVSNSLTVSGQDASWTYPRLAALGIDAEIGQVCFSGQGYAVSGYGNVPAVYNSVLSSAAWANYYSGASRTSQPLDYIINSHGINSTSMTSSSVQNWMTQARAQYATAKIFVLVPWNQAQASTITTGFNAYTAANPSDTNVYLINPGVDISGGTASGLTTSSNANHPNTRGDARAASYYAGLIRQAVGGSGTTYIFGGEY